MNKKPVVVLDACVIYPAPVRDFLLHIAIEGLFIPKWSNRIQVEWIKNLLIKRPDLSEAALNKTIKAMNIAFPEANVEEDSTLEKKLTLPDINDSHVLATAIRGKASVILTFNLKDFPNKYLNDFGIVAISPDDFIVELFDSTLVNRAFKNQVKNLKRPPIKSEDLLQIFSKVGLHKTAFKLSKLN